MLENQPQLAPNVLDALQIFANTAWHNPSAFLRTHRSCTLRDVEYLDCQHHSVALQYLFGCAPAGYNKILVRDEYRDALQALQIDGMYKRGAYITGQPGIGKTFFLIYALIERLREHKPVAVQLRASDPFYALFTHTCTLCSLSDPGPLVQGDVWALCDLRASTGAPLDIFQDVSAKVVQATLPYVKHWETWSHYRGAEMFVMNIWSEEEIADLSSLLELDVGRMTALSAKWGGVPRTLLQQRMKAEPQQDWELRRAAVRVSENYTTLFPALHTLDTQEVGTTSPIFFVLPFKDHAGDICRHRYVIRVPTETLENALAIALRQMPSKVRIDFFQLLSTQPGTRSCIRNIYINWLHSFITSGGSSQCYWKRDRYRFTGVLEAKWTGQLPVIRGAVVPINPPYYWIPPRGEFPGIDSVLVVDRKLYAIQAPTCFQPLSSPKVGFDKLRNLLSAPLQNFQLDWHVLSVGISNELILSSHHLHHWHDEFKDVTIGQCIIDPAEVGVFDEARDLMYMRSMRLWLTQHFTETYRGRARARVVW